MGTQNSSKKNSSKNSSKIAEFQTTKFMDKSKVDISSIFVAFLENMNFYSGRSDVLRGRRFCTVESSDVTVDS